MALEILIPRLGWNMEEGTFLGWLKDDGDTIAPGEPVFLIETDKATQEVEAIEGGVLRIAPDAPSKGETIPVGTLIGYVVQPGESDPFEGKSANNVARAEGTPSAAAPKASPAPAQPTPPKPAARPTPVEPLVAVGGRTTPRRRRRTAISPRARRAAKELGVDWKRLKGSGRSGRISERDIKREAESPGGGGPGLGDSIPLTPIRRRVAERMVASRESTVPVTLTTEADATELVALRGRLKAAANQNGQSAPSYQDLFVRIVAQALEEHPVLNATWQDDALLVAESINVGIAVDTDDGLIVPVIHNAHTLSLEDIAGRTRELIDQARRGASRVEDLSGGTFTITNLGMHGVDAFTPIINPPQCAILGLGRIVEKPAVVDGMIAARHMMALSLSFDHRIADGAPAARFLDTVRLAVEDPES